MDKPALLGIVRRRWYIFVLGLLGSMVLGYTASLASPPQYNARALILLLPSKATVGDDGNPFLELSGLDLPARVVVSSLSSSSSRDRVAEEFPNIDYEATIEESTRGPVIAIDVTGASEQTALAALPSLILLATSTLNRLQEEVNAPASASVRSMILAEDRAATEERGGTVRLTIAGIVLGLVATVLAAAAVDGRIRQRRATKMAGAAVPSTLPEPQEQSEPHALQEHHADPAAQELAHSGTDEVRLTAPAPPSASPPSAGSPRATGAGAKATGRVNGKPSPKARSAKNRRSNKGAARNKRSS